MSNPNLKGNTLGLRHGHSRNRRPSPEYHSWTSMISRCCCNTPANKANWDRYGGRGIKVCERWKTFANFLADMGPKPTPKHSIERKDNNGNYEKSNCKWATDREQGRNTRTNRVLEYRGEKKCLTEWAEVFKIDRWTLAQRLRMGWALERALTQPVTIRKNHRPFPTPTPAQVPASKPTTPQ